MMNTVKEPVPIDWEELRQIAAAARAGGLVVRYNLFLHPDSPYYNRGSEGKRAVGLVLTAEEDVVVRAQRDTDVHSSVFDHPRARWEATPKEALLASLACLEALQVRPEPESF